MLGSFADKEMPRESCSLLVLLLAAVDLIYKWWLYVQSEDTNSAVKYPLRIAYPRHRSIDFGLVPTDLYFTTKTI